MQEKNSLSHYLTKLSSQGGVSNRHFQHSRVEIILNNSKYYNNCIDFNTIYYIRVIL